MNLDNSSGLIYQDFRFGLITREIYQVSEDRFEIHDLSDGWLTAEVDKDTMIGLLNGNISITSLKWQ